MERVKQRLPRRPMARPSGASRPAGGEVFSINFIRRDVLPLRVRRALIRVGIGWIAINALMAVALLSVWLAAHSHTASLQRELRSGQPTTKALAALRQDVGNLQERAEEQSARLHAAIGLRKPRLMVAGKLAALTETLPPRTWITSLAGDRERRTLTIQAAYLIDPDHPYETPAKGWLDALKTDARFATGLKQLAISRSARKTQGSTELLTFDLIAEWQP